MNPYETLGVAPDASTAEIKKAYRRRAQQTHPDRADGNAEEFKRVQAGYEILRDPARRKRYDETGDTTRPGAEQDPDAALRASLRELLNHALCSVSSAKYENVLKKATYVLREEKLVTEKKLQSKEEELHNAEEVRARLKPRANGEPPLLLGAAEELVFERRGEVSALRGRLDLIVQMQHALEACQYKTEKRDPAAPNVSKEALSMNEAMEQILRSSFYYGWTK